MLQSTEQPISAVLLHLDDNVVCLLRDHTRGEQPVFLQPDTTGRIARGPALQQDTALGHKIATNVMVKDQRVIKYGVVIGYATQRIDAGENVHLHNITDGYVFPPVVSTPTTWSSGRIPDERHQHNPERSPIARELGHAPRLPHVFAGFARQQGRPGIRNQLLVLSVCGLNAAGARKVHAALPGSLLVSTPYGRGQLGADKAFHDQMLINLACHANIGAVIILAPDQAMRLRYQSAVTESGRPGIGFSLQECGENTVALIEGAKAAGIELQQELDAMVRTPCPLQSLLIAMECGHSDASSGIVANPLVGDVADALIATGGAVIISETLEWAGTEPELYARCQSPKVAAKLKHLVAQRHAIAQAAGTDLHLGNPGPQNHEGGITTLVEKSRGAIAKGGNGRIAGALEQGECLHTGAGLFLMDTPTLSPESITSMVAASAQLVLFTTGHGNPYGSSIAPTIKITANPQTVERLPDQIDFDASPAFTGKRTRSSLLPNLTGLVIDVCEGRRVAAERLNEGDEVISRLSASV